MKKRLKYIIPFMLATLLLLGSCMTVCAAASAPVPTDDNYCYYVEVAKVGENTPCRIYYMQTKSLYNGSSVFVADSVYYADCVDGVWSDTLSYFKSPSRVGITSSDTEVLFSNHDILYEGSDEVFFRPLLVTLARVLPGVVLKKMEVILPIAVFCLALLIGSIVLLPRLKIFLLK